MYNILPRMAVVLMLMGQSSLGAAVELTKDGREVIRLAADEYNAIVDTNPVIVDKALSDYLRGVARGLQPAGARLPQNVTLQVTLLDRPMPEVYATANGHIILTRGALLALNNEAQLAAVLSHEVAHLLGNHYPGIYQAFKEKERRQRSKMFAAGIAGVVVGSAIDYAVEYHTQEIYADADSGEISYRKAAQKVAGLEAGAGMIDGFGEVYQSLPPETRAGTGDPRIPLEMVADAESLKLMVTAGYDPKEAGPAWRALRKQADRARQESTEALAMAFLPSHMRRLMYGVEHPAGGVRAEALTRTISQLPPDRPALLEALARSREIVLLSNGKRLSKAEQPFRKSVGAFVLATARDVHQEGDWENARHLYQSAWDSGFNSAEVAHGLGVAYLAGFPFAASEHEKQQAEHYLLKAVRLDPGMPEAYKALGELYGEWDRYEDGIAMYRRYLKAHPNASDRSRTERQIRKFERKARR